MLMYIAIRDLTKLFKLVSRYGLFQIPLKIRCPPKLHNLIQLFHEDMKVTIQCDSIIFESFSICS